MLQYIVIALAVVLYFMYAPYFDKLKPVEYSTLLPIRFEGPMAVNNRLDNVVKMHENEIHWPEAMAVHRDKIYTGLGDGRIVSISEGKPRTIAQTGGPCEGQHEEHLCGRPLGMQCDKNGQLYVVDAYHGLFVIDVNSGKKRQIVPSSKLVESKPLTFLNGIALDEEEQVLYMTQSSVKWNISMVVVSILEHESSGRLLKYDIKKNIISVLRDDLSFPNGVVLSHDKNSVLLAELNKHTILRYTIKGEGKGELEQLPLVLPGEPDNISRSKNGHYWVAVGNARTADLPTAYDRFSNYPLVRKAFLCMHHVLISPVCSILKLTSSKQAKELAFELQHLRAFADLSPTPTVVVEFDENGNVVQSLHAPTGKVSHISEVLEHKGHLYLGSWRNRYLGKVKL